MTEKDQDYNTNLRPFNSKFISISEILCTQMLFLCNFYMLLDRVPSLMILF